MEEKINEAVFQDYLQDFNFRIRNNKKKITERLDDEDKLISEATAEQLKYNNMISNLLEPLSSVTYNKKFSNIDKFKRANQLNMDIINSVIQRAEQSKEAIHEFENALDDYGKALNKNKLKFGLQGQLKDQLQSQIKQEVINLQDVSNNPDTVEEMRGHIFSKYTPIEKGGKRIKTRNNKIRNKKTRRNKKIKFN
jgi:hypothetical protein